MGGIVNMITDHQCIDPELGYWSNTIVQLFNEALTLRTMFRFC